ncbi:MAG TPA: amidohydrolase [Gemmatimonadaceae bacterium]|nr:amidohydrolase [Gemmatimonadaceae bacterium]
MRCIHLALVLLATAATSAAAQIPRLAARGTAPMLAGIDAASARYADVARQIWELAEVGYQEVKSSALLQAELRAAGFTVTSGVAGEPTAFVAEYGSGTPVIALLGEFDALPGLSQDSVPVRRPLRAGGAGHGCGHHLFGTGSVAAAIAVQRWMRANGVPGTLRVVGTPAEEGGSGKVFMVRDGVFADVDAAIVWHPAADNSVAGERSAANISGKFRFRGQAAHASSSPERGRSALDAVEAMNMMTNLLREHVPQETRIHYVITKGGAAPNVVPDDAEAYYYVRHPDRSVVKDVWRRVEDAAKGAALGTGTTYEMSIIGAVYSYLPNETLARVQQRALETVGGFTLSAAERDFAVRLQQSEGFRAVPLEATARVWPLAFGAPTLASTDVGDVSWVVPTVQLYAATWVPGTASHTWQATAAGGTSIGVKGMLVAAKSMALAAAELFTSPAIVAAAKAELAAKRGPGFQYETMLGDRKPPLDYRAGSAP